MDDADVDRARTLMRAAVDKSDREPLFHGLIGLLALQQGDGDEAFEAFSRCIAIGHVHEQRRASFHLWRARAADLRGEREAGLSDYRRVLGHHADGPVRKAAKRGLSQPYTDKRARRIDVDFTYADVVSP